MNFGCNTMQYRSNIAWLKIPFFCAIGGNRRSRKYCWNCIAKFLNLVSVEKNLVLGFLSTDVERILSFVKRSGLQCRAISRIAENGKNSFSAWCWKWGVRFQLDAENGVSVLVFSKLLKTGCRFQPVFCEHAEQIPNTDFVPKFFCGTYYLAMKLSRTGTWISEPVMI